MRILRARTFFLVSLFVHFTILWVSQRPQKKSLKPKGSEKERFLVQLKELDTAAVLPQIVETTLKTPSTPTQKAYLGQQNQKVERSTISQHLPQNKPMQQQHRPPVQMARLGVDFFKPSQNKDLAKDLERYSAWAQSLGSSPRELLEKVQQGHETALNTREFKYYSYYQRIKNQLEIAWVPLLRERIIKHFQAGKRFATDLRYLTKLFVTLDHQGKPLRVQLISESGSILLDETAQEAFEQAGPFPNPPQGMINAHGEVELSWEFIFKT